MFHSIDRGRGPTGLSFDGGKAAAELAELWVPPSGGAVSGRGPWGEFVYCQLDKELDMGHKR